MLKRFPLGTNQNDVWSYAQIIDPGIDGAYKDNRSWWKNNDQSTDERIGSSRILASISSIKIIDVSWIIAEAIKRQHDGTSLSELYLNRDVLRNNTGISFVN